MRRRRIAACWRRRLEARFDVPVFLRWLALNTIIGNVDAYGGVSGHNYYLYGSPRHRDRIFWIPWDHDLAMPTGGLGTPAPDTAIDLFHDRAATNWPLIRFLMDDPVYRAAYRAQMEQLLATVFEPSRIARDDAIRAGADLPLRLRSAGRDRSAATSSVRRPSSTPACTARTA